MSPKAITRALLFLVVLAFWCPAISAELAGRVVGVHDGDTITVLAANNTRYKIRLIGIDAPKTLALPFDTAPFGSMREKRTLRQSWVTRLVGKDVRRSYQSCDLSRVV